MRVRATSACEVAPASTDLSKRVSFTKVSSAGRGVDDVTNVSAQRVIAISGALIDCVE